MTTYTTLAVRETFRLAVQQALTRDLKSQKDWAKFQGIAEEAAERIDSERQAFREDFQTRLETAQTSYSDKTMTNTQIEQAHSIAGILQAEIKRSGSVRPKLEPDPRRPAGRRRDPCRPSPSPAHWTQPENLPKNASRSEKWRRAVILCNREAIGSDCKKMVYRGGCDFE